MYRDYDETVDLIATVIEVFPLATEKQVMEYIEQMENCLLTVKKLL